MTTGVKTCDQRGRLHRMRLIAARAGIEQRRRRANRARFEIAQAGLQLAGKRRQSFELSVGVFELLPKNVAHLAHRRGAVLLVLELGEELADLRQREPEELEL